MLIATLVVLMWTLSNLLKQVLQLLKAHGLSKAMQKRMHKLLRIRTLNLLVNGFPPAPKYKATYEFVSADPNRSLPAEVTELLPTDANEYTDGTPVQAVQPAKRKLLK